MTRPKEVCWSDPNMKETAAQKIATLEQQLKTATPLQRRYIEKSLEIYRRAIDDNIK